MPSMTWRARLPRPEDIPNPVQDGDTCWLESDQGDWYRKVRDCRLFNVFAPELKQTGGPECKKFAQDWIAKWNVGRWPFWVDTIQTSKGLDLMTFNRYVTVVWNADRTSQLNAEMTAFVKVNGYPGGTGSGTVVLAGITPEVTPEVAAELKRRAQDAR